MVEGDAGARRCRGRQTLSTLASRAVIQRVRFRVLIEQDEDGVLVATCPSLPGCVSEGRTRQEALTGIRDAIAGYVASLEKHGDPIPPPIDEEIVEVSA